MIFNIDIQKHKIKPKGKILDIGSGNYPFIKEGLDITYIDKYPNENISRKSNFVEVPGLIKMDIEDMFSFKNKNFDYVIAGDVIEHTKNPVKACKEIIRVGKAGWIRCPTVLWEILFGRKYHLWATNLINNILIFYPKNAYYKSWEYPDDFKRYFIPETLHCSFEWKRNFDYKVV